MRKWSTSIQPDITFQSVLYNQANRFSYDEILERLEVIQNYHNYYNLVDIFTKCWNEYTLYLL